MDRGARARPSGTSAVPRGNGNLRTLPASRTGSSLIPDTAASVTIG